MKAFQFQLGRILHIRVAQERTEQQKLDQVRSAKAGIEAEIAALDQSVVDSQQRLRAETTVYAAELLQLRAYERSVQRVREQLVQRLAEQERIVRAQSEALLLAKRNVKLLERLRDKRRTEWLAEADRELEAFTSDFAASQWIRAHPPTD